jgi:hypothetical protein
MGAHHQSYGSRAERLRLDRLVCRSSVRSAKAASTLIGVFAFAIATAALAQNSLTTIVGSTPNEVKSGSVALIGHYESQQLLRLVIGLQHPRMAEEQQLLRDLYRKGSPSYHKYLTAEEWNQRFAPSAVSEAAVIDWASQSGFTVTQRYPNRLLVDLEAPVSVIEKALGITINSYSTSDGLEFSNDRDPQIPSSLVNIIHSIGGLNSIQKVHPASNHEGPLSMKSSVFSPGPVIGEKHTDVAGRPFKGGGQSKSPAEFSATNTYSPSMIFSSQAYDAVPLMLVADCCDLTETPSPSTSIAIATEGVYAVSDLLEFFSEFGGGTDVSSIPIDGTTTDTHLETTMDIEWSAAWAQAAVNSTEDFTHYASVSVYEGANALISTFSDIFNAMLTNGYARVMSTSWGCSESCTGTSSLETDEGIFAAMSAQGWTLIAAAGDRGATDACSDALLVDYPASDPNVVAAGGTTLQLDAFGNYVSEVGWTGGTASGSCANNDGGGGGGFSQVFPKPSYQGPFAGNTRIVPDVALNASMPQYVYYAGTWYGDGGTSIVAPELAGLVVQINAYLNYIAAITGSPSSAPVGNLNAYLYSFGENPAGFPYAPFYDITSGCNSNDITALYSLFYYCAGPGFDLVTGWGSLNALRLAWQIAYGFAGDDGPPNIGFPSQFNPPAINAWYNTNQVLTFSLVDTAANGRPAVGVAGYTADWDKVIPESQSEPTPGSGDGFYGPQASLLRIPSANVSYFGSLDLDAAGQGCHTAQIRAWDNTGITSYQTYGPICYDTVPPVTAATLSGTLVSGRYDSQVSVTLAATDASSGVAALYYKVGNGTAHSYVSYTGPFSIDDAGDHTISYYAVDVAGNAETPVSTAFKIAPVYSVALNTASLKFPNTAENTTSAVKEITLTNTGTETATISSVALSGTNPSAFAIASNTCVSVKAGKTCKVGIEFKPTSVGTFNAVVRYTDNASGSPQSVALTGKGIT